MKQRGLACLITCVLLLTSCAIKPEQLPTGEPTPAPVTETVPEQTPAAQVDAQKGTASEPGKTTAASGETAATESVPKAAGLTIADFCVINTYNNKKIYLGMDLEDAKKALSNLEENTLGWSPYKVQYYGITLTYDENNTIIGISLGDSFDKNDKSKLFVNPRKLKLGAKSIDVLKKYGETSAKKAYVYVYFPKSQKNIILKSGDKLTKKLGNSKDALFISFQPENNKVVGILIGNYEVAQEYKGFFG